MIKLSTRTGGVFFMVYSVDGRDHIATYEDVERALKHERTLLARAVMEARFPTVESEAATKKERKPRG
jgi:hypothetical protein